MHFGSRIYQYENAFIDDLAKLVSIPSVCTTATGEYPFGEQSAKALNWILKRAEEMGFEVANVDNYAGHAEFGIGEHMSAVLAHVDVVPAGDGWDSDPFTLSTKRRFIIWKRCAGRQRCCPDGALLSKGIKRCRCYSKTPTQSDFWCRRRGGNG